MGRKLFSNYWFKQGRFAFGEQFSVALIGFVTFFFLIRFLSKQDFGIWTLFLSVTTFIEIARIGILQNGTVKYLVQGSKQDQVAISTASFLLNLISAIGSALLLLGFARWLGSLWHAPILQKMFSIYLVTTILMVPIHHGTILCQANHRFKFIFWINILYRGLFLICILFVYQFLSLGLIVLPVLQLLGVGITAIVTYLLCRDYFAFKALDYRWIKKLIHFGKFVFGTNLSTMLYKSLDKYMLGAMLNPISVSIYELAIRITQIVGIPNRAMANLVYPQNAEINPTNTGALRNIYEKAVAAIYIFVLPFVILTLLFTEPIILFFAGESYLDAVPVLRITILYALFIPFGVQFGTLLDSIGKPSVNFYFTSFSLVINGIANYLFIRQFGVMGAAYGTLTSFVLFFFVSQTYLYRNFAIQPWNIFYHIWTWVSKDFPLLISKRRS